MNHLLWILICLTLWMLVEPSPYMQNPTYNYNHAGFLSANSKCDGIAADCINTDDQEMMMDSDISRRILAQSGYISYGALQRDNVPCNVRGNSYYNCNSNQQANPYSRSCNRITYCARNNH
ncbi:hypothetical protein Pfo_013882 [Paulownia fortunei]|nr:hypothetical protein Pfo_013882 [Paulownia fortunei]